MVSASSAPPRATLQRSDSRELRCARQTFDARGPRPALRNMFTWPLGAVRTNWRSWIEPGLALYRGHRRACCFGLAEGRDGFTRRRGGRGGGSRRGLRVLRASACNRATFGLPETPMRPRRRQPSVHSVRSGVENALAVSRPHFPLNCATSFSKPARLRASPTSASTSVRWLRRPTWPRQPLA